MRIAVIGTGYVGLVTGVCFSTFGHEVVCVDVDAHKIERLRRGESPIYEPGIEPLMRRGIDSGCLTFTADIQDALRGASIVFLAVGTPIGEDGAADLSAVFAAAEAVGRALCGPAIVVTKSTVPVGTTQKVRAIIAGVTSELFSVANNPEFLKEGDAVRDFQRPDRVVIGTDPADGATRQTLRRLYQPFVREPERILEMDIRSSELTKYAANAMLATRISFMNEVAALCEAVGADVTAVRQGVGSDSRIGSAFLYAGVGFGGSCFGKDLHALCATGHEAGVYLAVVEAVLLRNQAQREKFAEKIRAQFRGDVSGRVIAVWGLSFKPETDDVRDAPALTIIQDLIEAGAVVRAHDPVAIDHARAHFAAKGISPPVLCDDAYEAARGADALVLCTEWRTLRCPDFAQLRRVMRGTVLLDGRNVWDQAAAAAAGFTYCGVGRP